jgi:orotate phosphoribosyltransferase-like protein
MAKIKELVTEICELYDEEGLTIKEISDRVEMPEDEVIEVLSEYSMTF